MATTGLDNRETNQLAAKLALLDRILERHFLLGAEAAPMKKVAEAMRLRLNPDDPASLIAEADRLIERNRTVYFIEDALAEFAA